MRSDAAQPAHSVFDVDGVGNVDFGAPVVGSQKDEALG